MLRSVLAAGLMTGSLLVAAPAMAATPVITQQTNSVPTVYPEIDGHIDTITFGWKVDPALSEGASLTLDVMDAATHSSVFQQVFDDPATTSYVWNGRTAGSSLVPAGIYYVRITADNGTDPADSNNGPAFEVSAKKLTEVTWTKQLTAAAANKGTVVGPCGQVRKPGPTLGTGSLGFYPNGKCAGKRPMLAGSFNEVSVPSSFKPAKVRLSVYGKRISAGATMKAGFIGDPRPFKLGSAKGWHTGPLVPADRSMIDANRLGWVAIAQGTNRYEIKYFKITYIYTTLS